MSASPSSSPPRTRAADSPKKWDSGRSAEDKLRAITEQLNEIRKQRRQLSPDKEERSRTSRKNRKPESQNTTRTLSSQPAAGEGGGDGGSPLKVVREYFHPQLEYVMAEVAHSPYMTSPIESYPKDTLHLSGKIRYLKALGKKSKDLAEEERPCNFAEARKIFARIVNYKATFEGSSIDSNDRAATIPPLRVKTPKKHGKSGLLKASCARGGPAKYARQIKLIREQHQSDHFGENRKVRVTLEPLDIEDKKSPSPSMRSSPHLPGTKKDPYTSAGSSPAKPDSANLNGSGGENGLMSHDTAHASDPGTSQAADVDKEKSVDDVSYGNDFETPGPQLVKAGDSIGDGIYDDDDEDFESYTSNKIMQHALSASKEEEEKRSSARAGAASNAHRAPSSTLTDAAKRPPFMSSSELAAHDNNGISKAVKLSGNGDVSDLEDSVS